MLKVEPKCVLNVEHDEILDHVRENITRPLPQVQPHGLQDKVIAIACGGPSLEGSFDELKEKHASGMPVVSTNATHDWLLKRGIRPAAHVQIDARQFNARFVENWQCGTKYLIASQSHPDVFDNLEGADTWIWHCMSIDGEKSILDRHYLGNYYTIPGGSTVGLRAIALMRMLGFRRMEMYGMDSCYMDDRHHAYDQDENDTNQIGDVTVGGKTFTCAAWMHSQAVDFCEMVKHLGDDFELLVHGDGLIAHILKTGSTLLEDK